MNEKKNMFRRMESNVRGIKQCIVSVRKERNGSIYRFTRRKKNWTGKKSIGASFHSSWYYK